MTCFKLPVPPQPAIVTFKDTKRQGNAPDEATRKLSHFLDLALNHTARGEAAVENFTAKLPEKLEYASVGRLLFFRRSIPFYISGVDRSHGILLLVLHQMHSTEDTESQIIAAAIAAYVANNKLLRKGTLHTPSRPFQFPRHRYSQHQLYILQNHRHSRTEHRRTARNLSCDSNRGFQYLPLLPRCHMPGMYPLENRVELLACLEASKQIKVACRAFRYSLELPYPRFFTSEAKVHA